MGLLEQKNMCLLGIIQITNLLRVFIICMLFSYTCIYIVFRTSKLPILL